MNITGQVKLKDNITIYDLINIIKTIVPLVIRKDESGVVYTPYYKELALHAGIVKYLVEGIEIEKDDNILEYVDHNKEISNVIMEFVQYHLDDMDFIRTNVNDIVNQKKQEYSTPDFSDLKEMLKRSIEKEMIYNDLNIKLAKKQNTLLSQQLKINEYQKKVMDSMTPEESIELNKKLLSGEFDISKMADIIVTKYLDSEIHKDKEKELIESLTNKISDLKKYKSMHEARNVLSDIKGK